MFVCPVETINGRAVRRRIWFGCVKYRRKSLGGDNKKCFVKSDVWKMFRGKHFGEVMQEGNFVRGGKRLEDDKGQEERLGRE